MELIEVKIRNYRSVENEQIFPILGSMTLVGPNNSGKTNLLRALQTFFTGYENTLGYSRDADLTFGVGRAQTSITATFNGDSNLDRDIYESLDELHSLQGTIRSGSDVPLLLYFTGSSTPVYNLFPNVKRPDNGAQAVQYSRIHKTLINNLLSKFKVYYVPSAKSVEQIYDDLLTPYLRRKVSEVIVPHVDSIRASLDGAADALNQELERANLSSFRARFSLPSQSIEELVSGFDLMVSDPQETSVNSKGMGIQTTVLLAAFRWITRQETNNGHTVLWLLEEPESYLHPNLAVNCNMLLDSLAEDGIVVKTTHAMAFVPQDPNHVCGVHLNNSNRTEITRFRSFVEAVSSIRSALGIRFGDFYNLSKYNIFVEGQSDREIFQWFLNKIPTSEYTWEYFREAKIEDFGGVKHLSGFIRATYEFIREERASVVVFDGDSAGEKERRALQSYFSNKQIPFEANLHFVSVRSGFAIEGLFPDEWIKHIHKEHPSWFDDFSIDVSGNLEPFTIKDSRKSNTQALLVSYAEEEENLNWAQRLSQVCDTLNNALGQLDSQMNERNH